MLKEFPLNRVFTLIEPGPVLLVTTTADRKKNIMTITWSFAMSFAPMFGIVTGSFSQSEDDRRGAEAFQKKYGDDHVTLAIYPDNFIDESETTLCDRF